MIHSAVDTFLTYITGLSFVDKIGGVVYPFQNKTIGEGGGVFIKTIPIYGNNPTVCKNEPYIDLVPDERYRSVVYFEATPETITSTMGSKVVAECTLTLVAWFNLPRINQMFTADNAKHNCEAMIRALVNQIKGKHTIGDSVIDIELTEMNYRDPAIFGRWSYDEAEKQYLLFPFDFGAARFDVQLIYDLCDNEPIIDHDCLNA